MIHPLDSVMDTNLRLRLDALTEEACNSANPWPHIAQSSWLQFCIRHGQACRGRDALEWLEMTHHVFSRGLPWELTPMWVIQSLVAWWHLGVWGDQSQQEKWGGLGGAVAVTETRGASAKVLETSALTKSDHFILNGDKTFVTHAAEADFFLVLAVTGHHTAAPNRKSFAFFIVPRSAPGLYVKTLPAFPGMKDVSHGQLALDQCRIERGNILSPEIEAYEHIARPFRALEQLMFDMALSGALHGFLQKLRGACTDQAHWNAWMQAQTSVAMQSAWLRRKAALWSPGQREHADITAISSMQWCHVLSAVENLVGCVNITDYLTGQWRLMQMTLQFRTRKSAEQTAKEPLNKS